MSNRLPFIKGQCSKIISSQLWKSDYKNKDSPGSLCNGHMFWYIASLEYFPQDDCLNLLPEFPLTDSLHADWNFTDHKVKRTRSANNYLDSLMKSYSAELEDVKKEISVLSEELYSNSLALNLKQNVSEEPYFDKIRLLSCDEGESLNERLYANQLKSNLEEKTRCLICSEDKLPEEDLVTCSNCELSIHMVCYGIKEKVLKWVCEPCLVLSQDSRDTAYCIICNKVGGALKKSPCSVASDESTGKEEMTCDIRWMHVSCSYKDNVNSKYSDNSPRSPATSKASTSKNTSYNDDNFPELSKQNKSTDGQQARSWKPVKLRKILDTQKKKIIDDLYLFCRAFEKWEQKALSSTQVPKKKRKTSKKVASWKSFTPVEDMALEFRIQQFLHRVNYSQKIPFTLSINLSANTRKSKVNIIRPQYFTLILPEVILEDRIHIDHRTPEECFKRYQDALYIKLKNDILLRGERLFIFQGRDLGLSLSSKYKKDSKQAKKSSAKSSPAKRKREKLIRAQVSKDTYCICNKPYYYVLPRKPNWTDEEFEKKIRDNEMIECTKCENWFHFGCIQYEGTLENAQEDDNWKCHACSMKKRKKE